MYKYPYKTKIAEHGKVLINLVDFECAKVTKLDFGKSTVSDLAKQCFMEEIQERINNRQEIPIPKSYPFVAEEIELDWKTVLRIQLSNWFIKNSRLKSVDEIDEEYSERSLMEMCRGSLSTEKIQHLFLLDKELNMVDVMELAYAFYIDIVFHAVKLEFKDND